MKLFIDKIENGKVELLLNEQQLIVDISDIPTEAKEGDYLDIEFKLNKTYSSKVKDSINKLIGEITTSVGGDFDI